MNVDEGCLAAYYNGMDIDITWTAEEILVTYYLDKNGEQCTLSQVHHAVIDMFSMVIRIDAETTDERLAEIEALIMDGAASAKDIGVLSGVKKYLRDLRRQCQENDD
jgi:hypothetical protein